MKTIREPVLHFVLLGALLFALASARSTVRGSREEERGPVVISAEEVRRLRADYTARRGAAPSPGELRALVEEAVDEELLEREARRLGLGVDDPSVRRRLVGKMRAVAADPGASEEELYRAALELGLDDDLVIRRHLRQQMRLLLAEDLTGEPASEEDLAACLERHGERFVQPPTVSFSQVFLGDGSVERAAAVAARLREESLAPEEAAALSDPFPLAATSRARSRGGVARVFGARFADEVFALEPGTWSDPIASPFGLHVVRVRERNAGGLPPLAAVREQVARTLAEERAAERSRRGLERLRGLYEIRVEEPIS